MTIAEIIAQIKTNPLLDGVTFSGGEPFSQCNGFSALAKEIRVQFPRFDIWSYSGYTYEQIIASPDRAKLLKQLDILVDSPFMEDKMSYALRFRGSSNQRIINVKRSAERGKIVLAEQYL
jgi:anaerobic ribonucleoside-triphosphate reductase activating protein